MTTSKKGGGAQRRFNFEKYGKYLGVLPDRELAKMSGVGLASIVYQRRKYGIQASHDPIKPWTREEYEMLGVFTDDEVAKKTGRSKAGVQLRRQRLNIAPRQSINDKDAESVIPLLVSNEKRESWVLQSRAAGQSLQDWLMQKIDGKQRGKQ